jgi:hypothetical protein
MESVFWKAAYAVFSAVGVGLFSSFIKVAIFYSFKGKESVVKILYGFGKAAEGVFVGFFAKLKFLGNECIFYKDYRLRISGHLGFLKGRHCRSYAFFIVDTSLLLFSSGSKTFSAIINTSCCRNYAIY